MTPQPTEPILRARLSAGYGSVTTLQDIAFDLHPGEALGVVGTSGAGKSTLVLALLGLLPWRGGWARGEVLLTAPDGSTQNLLTLPEPAARLLRGPRIALVPQSPLSALNPAVSLRAHFLEAWRAHTPRTSSRALKASLAARLETLLPEVQLTPDPAFLARRPGAISVGQAQRITLALALLHRPAILIADEPTSALDPVTQSEILTLLRTLLAASAHQPSATALLYISHDLLSVLQLCTSLAVLDAGRITDHLPLPTLPPPHSPALTRLLNSLPHLPTPPRHPDPA